MTDPKPVRQQVLEAASKHLEERAEVYGEADDCLALAGMMQTVWRNFAAERWPPESMPPNWSYAHDTAVCMILLKVARLATGTRTRDTYEDIAGYAALAAEIQARETEEPE